MASEITMPKLSDTMTEGRLISWKKGVGDTVSRGDVIAEVETDKANMELEAFTPGVLIEVRAKPGDMVPVGTVLGMIGTPGEKPGEAVPTEKPETEAPPSVLAVGPETDQPTPTAEQKEREEEPERKPAPLQKEVPTQAAQAGERKTPARETEKASPQVRRLAREMGIDLQTVKGTGPEGRILREDLGRTAGRSKERQPGAEEVPEEPKGTGDREEPVSRIRSAIARTVSESWSTIPHFFVTVSVEMSECERLRRGLKEEGGAVTVNDIVVKATARALGRFPRLNASFGAEKTLMHDRINIGIAVAVDDGLFVPVIKDCQSLSLGQIAEESRRLVDRTRSGSISEQEISGGTFSISNLGMFGVEEFMAVILPPQCAILAIGAVTDAVVVRQGVPVASRVMKATLSADHRIVDGAYAARFLSELKRILENPVGLLL